MTMVTFRVPGRAMSTIEGSELSLNPVKYDGGSQGAYDAKVALDNAHGGYLGNGISYRVTATRAGADTIADYCETVGSTFAMESEAEIRSEGRALLVTAERIRKALA
jgi:hypothetical protein